MKTAATVVTPLAFLALAACGTTQAGKYQDNLSIAEQSANAGEGASIVANSAATDMAVAKQMPQGSWTQQMLAVVAANNGETAKNVSEAGKIGSAKATQDLRELSEKD